MHARTPHARARMHVHTLPPHTPHKTAQNRTKPHITTCVVSPPRHGRHRSHDTWHDHAHHNQYEVVADLYNDPASRADLLQHIGADPIPGLADNPFTISAGGSDNVVPLKLFCDGVSFTKHDSFMAWTIGPVNASWSEVVCCIRSTDMCDCGCQHAHSLDAIEEALICKLFVAQPRHQNYRSWLQ